MAATHSRASTLTPASDCQAKHWRAEHKAVCGKLPKPAAKAAKNTVAARTAAAVTAVTTAGPLSSMSIAEFFEDSCVPVKLGASSTHGRSLLAKAALPPGVLVLAADRYAGTTLPAHWLSIFYTRLQQSMLTAWCVSLHQLSQLLMLSPRGASTASTPAPPCSAAPSAKWPSFAPKSACSMRLPCTSYSVPH